MNVNGPLNLYKIKPLYDFSPKVDLPTCMYKVARIIEHNCSPSQENAVTIADDAVVPDHIEYRQTQLLKVLENLKSEVFSLKKELKIPEESVSSTMTIPVQKVPSKRLDIVVRANPEYPPYSVWVFRELLQGVLKVQMATYLHSSLSRVPEKVKTLECVKDTGHFDITFTVIWKQCDGEHAEMMVDPVHQTMIAGEVNIARYLARLFLENYEQDPLVATENDVWLEAVHSSFVHGSSREQNALLKTMNSELGKRLYLVRNSLSIADIFTWSVMQQRNLHKSLPSNVEKWWKNLNSLPGFKLPSTD